MHASLHRNHAITDAERAVLVRAGRRVLAEMRVEIDYLREQARLKARGAAKVGEYVQAECELLQRAVRKFWRHRS